MRISRILGLLVLKVSSDLICEARATRLLELGGLESHPNEEADRPAKKRKKGKKVKGANLVPFDEGALGDEGTPDIKGDKGGKKAKKEKKTKPKKLTVRNKLKNKFNSLLNFLKGKRKTKDAAETEEPADTDVDENGEGLNAKDNLEGANFQDLTTDDDLEGEGVQDLNFNDNLEGETVGDFNEKLNLEGGNTEDLNGEDNLGGENLDLNPNNNPEGENLTGLDTNTNLEGGNDQGLNAEDNLGAESAQDLGGDDNLEAENPVDSALGETEGEPLADDSNPEAPENEEPLELEEKKKTKKDKGEKKEKKKGRLQRFKKKVKKLGKRAKKLGKKAKKKLSFLTISDTPVDTASLLSKQDSFSDDGVDLSGDAFDLMKALKATTPRMKTAGAPKKPATKAPQDDFELPGPDAEETIVPAQAPLSVSKTQGLPTPPASETPKPEVTTPKKEETPATYDDFNLEDALLSDEELEKLKKPADSGKGAAGGILDTLGKVVTGAIGGNDTNKKTEDASDKKEGLKKTEDESDKPLKSKTKIEDINPAKKTSYKEKLIDTDYNKEFKEELDDASFGLSVKDKKTREISGDREQGTTNKTIYIPRDPAEDWNNSGLAASLRYLGSGYDIVFGNPLGDPVVMMDQGYRNPVIKLNWDVEYLNKDGANLKEPYGSWVRPEFSCRQSETIDHINTIDDFKRELSVDAQASYSIPYFFSFSGSTGYKNFVKSTATNKVRTYITKTYCLRYVAGIVNYRSVDTTPEFKKAVSNLPNYFDSQACTLETFKSNEDDPMCAGSVKPWVQFIKMFGTHFTTIVHLGGKITHQIQINKSDVLDMQQHGVNVDVAVKAAISPTLLDNLNLTVKNETDISKMSQRDHFKYEKQVLVIGGDGLVDSKDLKSLNCWTKDLYKKPMPIKVKLESIKSLFTDQKHRDSFEEALKFYSETYGVSPDEIYKKFGKEFGIGSTVQKGHQVVFSGTRSGSAVCPNKTVILMGFALTITKKKNFIGKNDFYLHVSHCPVGEEKCTVSSDNQNSQARIWAVCGEDTIPLLNQQAVVAKDDAATATCPSGYSIAYGFGFSIPKGNVALKTDAYACRSGTPSCTHESADKSAANGVWIACVENGAPQLTEITNHAVSTSSRQCGSKANENQYNDNLCPNNSTLIAGVSFDFSEFDNASYNQIAKCVKNTPGCKVDKRVATSEKCRSHYSWIACMQRPEQSKEEAKETKVAKAN